MRSFGKAFIKILLILASSIFIISSDLYSQNKERRCEDLLALVPMRDGMFLPTAIYFPNNNVEELANLPCVLIRNPLGTSHFNDSWNELLESGYVVAIQATRSCCDSSGRTLPYASDGWGELSDGYDTIEWLAKSGWTNGKIGTIGTSATGITQYLLAPSQPPHLVCQHIEFASPSLYHYCVWPGNQFRKESVEGWLKVNKSHPEVLSYLKNQRYNCSFWQRFNSISKADSVNIPQAHIAGWYDIFLQGTIDSFLASQQRLEDSISDQHKLVIGPWSHRYKTESSFGDFPTPPQSTNPPHQISLTAWLDYHLKGIDNDIDSAPQIQYYVMGPLDGTSSSGNVWRVAKKWPPDAKNVQLYLSNNGMLIEDRKHCKEGMCNIKINLNNPVPTIGGRNLFIPAGPKDQSSIENRDDIVLFTTDEFSEDYEVTGKISACLYVDQTYEERDICLRLTDVYPDGKSVLITEGSHHINPKKDSESPIPIVVDLWSTSMVFAKGHRIRLSVSGSNYPALDISNSNPTSINVSTGGRFASYLAIPNICQEKRDFVDSSNANITKISIIDDSLDDTYSTFGPWPQIELCSNEISFYNT